MADEQPWRARARRPRVQILAGDCHRPKARPRHGLRANPGAGLDARLQRYLSAAEHDYDYNDPHVFVAARGEANDTPDNRPLTTLRAGGGRFIPSSARKPFQIRSTRLCQKARTRLVEAMFRPSDGL